MKLRGWLVALAVLAVVGCSGEAPSEESEPATAAVEESEAAAEPTVDEMIAEMDAGCAEAAEAIAARQAESTLYERLGGREAIHGAITETVRLHRENETIVHLMEGVDDADLIEKVSDFVAQASGGDVAYEGRSMVETHASMGLTNEHFLAAGGDVQAALQTVGVGEGEIQEVMCMFASLRSEVVQM
jgi:hemoglobin